MIAKTGVHLVTRLCNAWTDRGDDPTPFSAQCLHRRDGCIGHPSHRAFPPGMSRADHPGLPIGQQHRRAIGSHHPQQQTGPVGHQRICMRPLGIGPGCSDNHAIGRMYLVDRRQPRARQNRRHRAAAIFGHGFGLVAGAKAGVEAGDHPGRHATAPAQEPVRQAFEQGRAVNFNRISQDFCSPAHSNPWTGRAQQGCALAQPASAPNGPALSAATAPVGRQSARRSAG